MENEKKSLNQKAEKIHEIYLSVNLSYIGFILGLMLAIIGLEKYINFTFTLKLCLFLVFSISSINLWLTERSRKEASRLSGLENLSQKILSEGYFHKLLHGFFGRSAFMITFSIWILMLLWTFGSNNRIITLKELVFTKSLEIDLFEFLIFFGLMFVFWFVRRVLEELGSKKRRAEQFY